MNYFVTIVVPVYNVYDYLRACVDSILNQTYKKYEIILVDDGSPDQSSVLCDEYASSYENISAIHQKNGGLGAARNTGMKHAKGDFITFVDGDDYIAPDHISNLIGRIIKDKSDACYGGYQQQVGNAFIPQVNPLSGRTYGKNEILHDFIPRMCGKLDYHIVDEVQMSVCMAMFSMEIIRENQIKCHSERELISEDFVFNLDFLEHAKKISISDSCGYYYRDNVASLTKVYQPNRLEKQVYFTKYIIERIKSLNIYDECIQRIYSTFFAWVRNIVKREQRFYRQIGFVHSLNNIKRVCDDPFVVMALKIYDDSNLTRNPALLNKLIRKKRILEIWLLSYIKEKTRK